MVAATKPVAKTIAAGDSLNVLTEIGGVFADGSANVRDSNKDTSLVVSLAVDTDSIWIGWRRPFSGLDIDIGTVNSVAARTLTAAVGQADGTYVGVTTRDLTAVGTSSLAQDGVVSVTEDPVVIRSWAQTTVNGTLAYWMRLRFLGGLTAGTSIVSLKIQPWFPSVDATNFPDDGLDRSGCFPHILFARVEGQQITWHDMGSLPSPDIIGTIIMADVGGSTKNRDRSLLLLGRSDVWQMELSQDDRPLMEVDPFTAIRGLLEGSARLVDPKQPARLVAVRVFGQQFDSSALLGRFYYSWDYGKPWSQVGGAIQQVPASLMALPGVEQLGSLFRWCFGWENQGSTFPSGQPAITSIEADFELLPTSLNQVQERRMQARPRF